jgi:Spy/CpxP family protein refolding chaperone
MVTKSAVTGCFIIAVATCIAAVAQPPKTSPAEAPPPASDKFKTPYGAHLEPILVKINASADQRQKIGAIVASYRPKIDPLRQEYKEKSNQFVNGLITGQPAEAVMAKQGELNKLYAVIVSQYSLMQLEIRKSLTPDQTRLFEEYKRQQGWTSSK